MFIHFFEQHLAQTMAFKEVTELENRGLIWQPIQLQAGKLVHGFDLVRGIFLDGIAQVIEQLHAVNAKHGGKRIRRTSVLALGVITGYPTSPAASTK